MLGRLAFVPTRSLARNVSFRLLHSSISWRAKSLRPFLLADIGEGITGGHNQLTRRSNIHLALLRTL